MPYEIKITVTESTIATEADAHARHNEIFLLIEDTLVEAGLMTDNTVIGGWPIVEYPAVDPEEDE